MAQVPDSREFGRNRRVGGLWHREEPSRPKSTMFSIRTDWVPNAAATNTKAALVTAEPDSFPYCGAHSKSEW